MTTDAAPDVREQLIVGGLRLVLEEGATDLSVRRLAQSANRTTMCVYTKFGNRKNLVTAIYERAAVELQSRLDAAGPSLPALAAAYRDFASGAPATYEFLFTYPMGALGLNPVLRSTLVADIVERIATADHGAANTDDARITWAAMHGLISLLQIVGIPESRGRKEYLRAIDSMLRGLTSPG